MASVGYKPPSFSSQVQSGAVFLWGVCVWAGGWVGGGHGRLLEGDTLESMLTPERKAAWEVATKQNEPVVSFFSLGDHQP